MTPNIERLETFEEHDLNRLMMEPLEVQAATIDARIRKIERINRTIYTELGALVLYFEEKRLYSLCFDETGERFKSMEAWLVSACPYSRSYALEAKAKIKILRDSGTPMDKLLFVPRCNVQLLAQLPPVLQRDEEIIKDAQVLAEDTFRSKVIREHPEAHIDPQKRVTWNFDQGAWEVIDEAIHLAMKKWDCSRQAAVEGVFAEFLVNNKREEVSPEIGQVAHA